MSSKPATAQAVARLYTAAGRNYADVELALYHEALAEVDDELLALAVADIVRGVDLGARAPSPALVIETADAIRHRRARERPALPESTAPPLPMSESARRARELRDRLRHPQVPPQAGDDGETGAA